MKRKLLAFLVTASLFLPLTALAASCGDPCSNPDSCNAVISACSAQIGILQTQAKTLSNQISAFNAQINLTEVKIQQTEDEIKLLGGRIDQVQSSLTDLNRAFSARAVATYEMSRVSSPVYFLLSGNLLEAVSKFHYLQQAESSDQSLLVRLQSAQTAYQNSKQQSE